MRPLPVLAVAGITVLILAATLAPEPAQAGHLTVLCLFCGDRAIADAIANVLLFVPLGAALAWVAPNTRGAWRIGLFLSLAVELAQRFIAGRDASLGDVLTNTLGTLLGLGLWRYVARGAVRPGPAAWLPALCGYGGAIVLGLWLLGPAPTAVDYFGQWTPALGHYAWYRGRVLDAAIAGAPIIRGAVADAATVRWFVRGRGALVVRFVAGPKTESLAPLVSVFDERQREIFVLGVDREALVLRYRRRAAAWRFDEPHLRFESAARAWAPGDTFAITVERTPTGACLVAQTASGCVRSATPGRAWSLVLFPDSFPAWSRTALDVLFMGGMALLLGWCVGTVRASVAAGVVALASIIVLPTVMGSAPAPPVELAGAAAGLVAGVRLRVAARHTSRPAL